MNNEVVMNIITFIISYIMFLLIYILIINRNRKDYNIGEKQTDIKYIKNKFKLNMNEVNYNWLKWTLTFTNSLILTIVFLILINIKSIILGIIIGFIVMLMLIYSFYEIIGRILKKKGEKNV